MDKGLEIKTFDGYQGNEKDYVIISFVRSNPAKAIGFLE
jgi:superfamily I DNA and/or RNA helicase